LQEISAILTARFDCQLEFWLKSMGCVENNNLGGSRQLCHVTSRACGKFAKPSELFRRVYLELDAPSIRHQCIFPNIETNTTSFPFAHSAIAKMTEADESQYEDGLAGGPGAPTPLGALDVSKQRAYVHECS